MDDEPTDYCKSCGDPIALYDVFDDPVCDCAPAQEEKEMENAVHIDGCWCGACEKKRTDATRTADLRERWDRAFFAVLGAGKGVTMAQAHADDAIRRHADMMAARDAVIAEVVANG